MAVLPTARQRRSLIYRYTPWSMHVGGALQAGPLPAWTNALTCVPLSLQSLRFECCGVNAVPFDKRCSGAIAGRLSEMCSPHPARSTRPVSTEEDSALRICCLRDESACARMSH